MATPLTDAINALTTYANGITGKSDANLPDAVRSLADGYGVGGGYSGIEIKTNTSGQITDYIFHGLDEIPQLSLTYAGYTRSASTGPVPIISFADKPTKIGKEAFYSCRCRIDWSGLSELEQVGESYALVPSYANWNDGSSDVVSLPKFVGYTASHSAINVFRGNSTFTITKGSNRQKTEREKSCLPHPLHDC